MPILYDFWENPVEITRSFVSHRNRTVDIHLIHTFQAKGRKLLVNTYKQNQSIPTMCIFFKDKETAEAAYREMKQIVYPENSPSKPVSSCEAMTYLFSAIAVPVVFLAAIVAKSC